MSITVLKYYLFYVQLYAGYKTNVQAPLELLKINGKNQNGTYVFVTSTCCENNGILFNVTHIHTDQLQRVLFLDGLCWQQAAEKAYIRRVGENTSFSLYRFVPNSRDEIIHIEFIHMTSLDKNDGTLNIFSHNLLRQSLQLKEILVTVEETGHTVFWLTACEQTLPVVFSSFDTCSVGFRPELVEGHFRFVQCFALGHFCVFWIIVLLEGLWPATKLPL